MLFLVTRPRPAAMLERSFVQLSWLAVCVLPLPKTQAPKSTFAWDQFASTVTVAIITIFCWEAAKYLYRRVCRWRERGEREPTTTSEPGMFDPEPEPSETEESLHEGLRRRRVPNPTVRSQPFLPVYVPEPDTEPTANQDTDLVQIAYAAEQAAHLAGRTAEPALAGDAAHLRVFNQTEGVYLT